MENLRQYPVIYKHQFISVEKTPTSARTPLKKSLFCAKQYKIKYIYMLFTTIYCMQKQFFSGVLQVVSKNKSFSVGVQSPTEINAPRGCAVILKRICQLSLLAHERSRFATCQWELLTPTDISIPLTHRLVLYTLEAGDCLFCVQECPRAGLQIKSARIPIFSDLTIEILTLTFPTRWQKRAVIHLIFYFYNIYNQFCPECNKIVFNKIL